MYEIKSRTKISAISESFFVERKIFRPEITILETSFPSIVVKLQSSSKTNFTCGSVISCLNPFMDRHSRMPNLK